MTQRVMLELFDPTLRRAKEAVRQMNRPLEAILIEWLDRASEIADISPLDVTATYRIYTPFGADATAQPLLEMLRNDDKDQSTVEAKNAV